MSDVRPLLERALETATHAGPAPDDFDRFVRYRERRRRNQRLAAGAVALALVLGVAGTAYSLLRTSGSSQPGTDGVVVDVPGANEGCFAEDPCWDTDMFVVRTDGTDVTRLGYDEARDLAYSWSPDGRRIAFFRGVAVENGDRTDTTADIYTMAADGTDVRRLTDDPGLDLFPVFSPDGSQIAFTSDRVGTVDVYLMEADGSNVVRVTEFENDSLDDYHPTWAPDGSQIAFVRGKIPPGGPGKLWVIDADGSNGHVVLDQPLVSFPAWSPDGTRIAFETGRWPNVRVQLLELASGAVSDLGTGFHPVWSPDSGRLAISMPEGGFAILDLDEPNRRQIVSRTSSFAAAWSPDGEWIVFNDAGLTANGG
jgi:Tol biopolymer transport system component